MYLDLFNDTNRLGSLAFLDHLAVVPGISTNAVVNLGSRYITLPEPGATRFYRIRSNIRARIIRQRTTPKRLQVFFTFQPIVFGLQSSAAIQGPYADESSATMDLERQTVTLSRSNSARFFRIRSDIQQSISNIHIVGDRLILTYE